jgi:hypothetical protein
VLCQQVWLGLSGHIKMSWQEVAPARRAVMQVTCSGAVLSKETTFSSLQFPCDTLQLLQSTGNMTAVLTVLQLPQDVSGLPLLLPLQHSRPISLSTHLAEVVKLDVERLNEVLHLLLGLARTCMITIVKRSDPQTVGLGTYSTLPSHNSTHATSVKCLSHQPVCMFNWQLYAAVADAQGWTV